MRLFTCKNCGQLVYFENAACLRCGSQLGFDAETQDLLTLSPDQNGTLTPLGGGQAYRICGNATQVDCNWLVPADSPDGFCLACSLNRTIPDLSDPVNQERWAAMESAKRRFTYAILRFGLPVTNEGLVFDFLASQPGAHVMTGHDEGLITIDIAEADPAERERRRLMLGEPYRTPLGHLRHESGHFYWNKLIRDAGRTEGVRAVFGDETQDYEEALKRHYEQGTPPGWQQDFVSSYATAHPWEDFAETWAHYMHIVDTVDTGDAFGLRVDPDVGTDDSLRAEINFDPYRARTIEEIIEVWLPLSYAMNSLNRSMGQPDLYPFVLSDSIITKLGFIHGLIHGKAN